MKMRWLVMALTISASGFASSYYECMAYDNGPVIAIVDLVKFQIYEDEGLPPGDPFFCPGLKVGIPLQYNGFGTKAFKDATYRYFEVSGSEGARRIHIRIFNPTPVANTWGKAKFHADIFSACRPELWALSPGDKSLPGGPVCYGF